MNEKLYDKYSTKYMEGNDRLTKYHNYRMSTFDSLLKENFKLDGASVLDYGCGDGVLSQFFNSGAYFGIDPSEEMIRLAKIKYIKRTFSVGGLAELENTLSDNRIDALICLNTLPYMVESEQSKFFSLAQKYQIPVVVSHTNELLDLNSFNRYTLEHRKALIGKSAELNGLLNQFREFLSFPDLPLPVSQTEVRFGESKLNSSERDTIKKFRVDPFSWPNETAIKYGFKVKAIQPIRIFALPPGVMESSDEAFDMLHSDYFDFLPLTYKLIFCSQFRVVFLPD